MKPDRWQQVDALFHAVAERAPHERAAFLDEACAGNDSLRREVESLLAADSAAEDMTVALPAQVAAGMLDEKPTRIIAERMLNQYQIVSPLGAGGMGEVFLAEDTRLHRKVALKLLPIQFANDPDRVRRFEQEAHVVSALNHPNIITLFDMGRAGEDYFLATEFIDGQTLRQRLRDSERLPLTEAVEITLQICQALAAAHEAGIVHRDIKPENVMLRRDGYVKVLDFGLAKVGENQPLSPDTSQSSLTDPGTVMGTASYMSPEQARGQRVDARTDIFSLGIVLYEMIASRAPFEGVNMFEMLAAIMEREPAPLTQHSSEVPDELQGIVSRMLRKDRDHRYQSVKEMLTDLENLRDEQKLAARLKGRQSPVEVTQTDGLRERTTEEIKETTSNSSAKIILGEIKRHKLGMMAMLTVLGILVAGGVFGIYKLLNNNSASVKTSSAAAKFTPLTSFAGLESKPSFSPDGNQIAFSWVGEAGDNTDIYIREIGGEGMRRLTTNPAIDTDAIWSPDGRYIAFFRLTEEGGAIFMMPTLGGVERKITDISPLRPPQILRGEMSWSPDGKTLAFPDRSSTAEPMGIVLLTLETGERRTLISPVPTSAGDYTPVFSPDGKTIAFNRSRNSEGNRDIYQIPVTGGEPRKITSVDTFLTDVDWLPNGKGIVYSTFGAREAGMYKLFLHDGVPERITGSEGNVLGVVSDRQRDRLVYIKGNYDIDIWRMGLREGKSDKQPPARFIASTTTENWVKYSPDGQKIAFLSDRSGVNRTWICDANGQNPVQIDLDNSRAYVPSWSPDGRKLVFSDRISGKAEIYAMNADRGQRKRLTEGDSNNSSPLWSHDGKWIYFKSDRSGTKGELWKMPSGGGEAVPVTKRTLGQFAESWDGKFLIYSKVQMTPGLWRLDLATGEESLLTNVHNAGYWWSWDVTPQGIYFATCETPLRSMVEFYDFATGKVSLVAKLQTPFPAPLTGLSISPDGRWMCYLQQQIYGDLMLMENVR